tara:strand:- start:349 stop:648 length:300 start_codon:yes stop_codon:yes gene_type:complete
LAEFGFLYDGYDGSHPGEEKIDQLILYILWWKLECPFLVKNIDFKWVQMLQDIDGHRKDREPEMLPFFITTKCPEADLKLCTYLVGGHPFSVFVDRSRG